MIIGRSRKAKFLRSAASTALCEWFMVGNWIEPANPKYEFADNKLERLGHGAVSAEELLGEVAKYVANDGVRGRTSDVKFLYGKERVENTSAL